MVGKHVEEMSNSEQVAATIQGAGDEKLAIAISDFIDEYRSKHGPTALKR